MYTMPAGTLLLHVTCEKDENHFSGFFSLDTPADMIFALGWKMKGCGGKVRVITYETIIEQRIVLLGGKLTPEDLCRHLNIPFPLDHGLWDNYTTRNELCKQGYDGWIQSIASEPTRKKGREVLLCNPDVVKQVQVESIWDYMRRTRNGWNKLLDENIVSELITNEDVDFLLFVATHLNVAWDEMLSNPASLDVHL